MDLCNPQARVRVTWVLGREDDGGGDSMAREYIVVVTVIIFFSLVEVFSLEEVLEVMPVDGD